MKNKEKYDLREFNVVTYNGSFSLFDKEKNEFKRFYTYSDFVEWLEEEYKEPIELTVVERIILENIDEQWKWIARGKNETLCLYREKPKRMYGNIWETTYCSSEHSISIFEHLFNFIKWENEEPYNIKELLESSEQ